MIQLLLLHLKRRRNCIYYKTDFHFIHKVNIRPKINTQDILDPDSSISGTDSFNHWYQQNQQWYQIDLDELYRLHSLLFSVDFSLVEKNQNYCLKIDKMLYGFVPEVVPTKLNMVTDRSRRALSIVLLTFLQRPLLHGEKLKITPKLQKLRMRVGASVSVPRNNDQRATS